jgi:glycosyltransferase involved in cell wall biosynthesis
MADLTVVVLTYNEEIHLARALASVKDIALEIVVVDSYSTDGTVEIAQSFGCTVLQNKFVSQSQQFEWALANAPMAGAWVMRLDADEIIEDDLAREIEERLPTLGSNVNGVNFRRKHIFMGKWLRFGGRYPLVLLRMWRRGTAHVEDRWMDEHMVLSSGETVTFSGGFADHNLNDLTFFIAKHNSYATREAIDVLNAKWNLFERRYAVGSENSSRQAHIKRFIKENLYNAMPFYISALLYFLYRFVIQLGFLDGRRGLVYHVLQGFWYRFLVGAKVMEMERAIGGLTDPDAVRTKLSQLTGYHFSPPR